MRPSKRVKAFGQDKTLSQWAKERGIPRPVIWKRIYRLGWTAEKALSEPPIPRGERHTPTDPIVRFMRHIRIADGDHWMWTANLDNRGMPRFRPDEQGEKVSARRWIYERLIGAAPSRVMPWCGESPCVNPYHADRKR